MSSMTIFFLKLQITRSEIRPHIKWAVSLVTAYGHFNFPQDFVSIYRIIYSRYHPEGKLIYLQRFSFLFDIILRCSITGCHFFLNFSILSMANRLTSTPIPSLLMVPQKV